MINAINGYCGERVKLKLQSNRRSDCVNSDSHLLPELHPSTRSRITGPKVNDEAVTVNTLS